VYQDADPMRASAFPYWMNPFRWSGVVETKDFFALTWVDSLAPEVDPDGSMEVRYKPEETPVTLAAKKSYLGRVYLDWAQYPITETEELSSPEQGYAVHFEDLRYQHPGRSTQPLSAGVILNRDLTVEAEFFGLRTRRPAEQSDYSGVYRLALRSPRESLSPFRPQLDSGLTTLLPRSTINVSTR
jgi:inner membrane protein